MNYQKLDAALATALEDVQDSEARIFSVFIRTEHVPTGAEVTLLERLGIKVSTEGQQVFTAALSAQAIRELSDQSWVQYLKLSRRLRLLNNSG
jgi:hypothetical protein